MNFLFFTGCNTPEESEADKMRKFNQKGEYIYRQHTEHLTYIPPLKPKSNNPYPWEDADNEQYPKINKEYFRCRGSRHNPMRTAIDTKGEPIRFHDCGGSSKHSLPLRNEKEFIYPILIDVLNYVQSKTEKKIVITCGHRCPTHNAYASDGSKEALYSKHMIGAEVTFYVQGLENQPEVIVKHIMNYFNDTAKYKDKKEYQIFQRYTKNDTNVSTQPWFNKEIFVKLYKKKEGRDFDNRHPYSYISIQVRFDEELEEKVAYSWEKAHQFHFK